MKPLGIATLSQLKYVVFDIETTGFSHKTERIIQISAVKIDGNRISQDLRKKVTEVDPNKPIKSDGLIYNAFINPKRSVPKKITELTGITNAMVKNQAGEENILPEFFKFVGDRILVAHNGIKFDVKFLEKSSKKVGLPNDNFLCLDTLWLSRKLYPEEKKHKLINIVERFSLQKKYPSSFLNQMHNALVDVMFTAEALKVFMAELNERGMDKLLLI